MAEIDDIKVKIAADASGVKKGTSDATKHLQGFAGSAASAFQGISAKAVAVGNIIAKVISKAFQAIANSIDDAVKRVDTLNNFPKVMSNLGIGASSAQKSIDYLQEKLLGLPTTLDAAALSVQRFTSANGNVEASTKMFLALNNAILAGGASAETQATALEQLSQAYAKGKPDMMEWRSAMTAMPAQLKQIATAMGYASASDLGDALREGRVSMNDFMATISKMNTQGMNGFKSFEEQARNATGGIQTSIVNLKTAITRGLATIVDAIGQTNIASFFNGVASAIGTAANYVAAFVRIVLTAINALRALFGQSAISFGKTSTAADDTVSSLEGISGAANDASKDIDGATGSAKKLAKQLAGFDEMNVLKEQDSSGGGGSGAGGAGSADLSGIDFGSLDVGNLTDKVQEAFDKIMGIFKNLDLSKWHLAIQNFRKATIKAFELIKRVGSSAWDNLFKPLARYIAENALPDFINEVSEAIQNINVDSIGGGFDTFFSGLETALQGVLDLFNPLVGVIGDFCTWLGNMVLPPALSVLGATLEIIGGLLSGIGEGIKFVWEESIKPALDLFAQAFQPIIDRINEMFGAIGKCEPLMETFKTIGQAIGVVVGAAFQYVAQVVMAVVGCVLLLIDGIIEMGTWVGNVILDVVDWFSNLGENIHNIFEGVKKFICDVWQNIWNFMVKVFTPIGNFFTGCFNTIKNVLSGVVNFFQNIFTGAFNAVKNAFSTVGSFFQSIFNTIKGIFVNIGTTIGNAVSGSFKGVVNGIIGFAEGFINTPVRAINALIDVINAIPGISIGKLGELHLPRMAKGGIVDGATIAMIGERGQEAVMPLENNTGWIDKLAKDIQERGGTNGEPIHITVNVGEDTLVDKLIDGVNDKSFLSNRLVFNV